MACLVAGQVPITKLSFYAYLKAIDSYRLLPSGAALGFGCGPQLIAPAGIDARDLGRLRIALPGENTTAHLLFSLMAPQAEKKRFVRYDQVVDAVLAGDADAGVIIHESRFTYAQRGLRLLVDLGQWWEETTGCPIPLGGIAARRDLDPVLVEDFSKLLTSSIESARSEPAAALPFMREHAREMDEEVLWQHVNMFVNDFSVNLGDVGNRAVRELETRARQAGIL